MNDYADKRNVSYDSIVNSLEVIEKSNSETGSKNMRKKYMIKIFDEG